MGTSKVNEREPVLNFLAPAGAETASFREPGESSLNDPAPGRITQFTWNGTCISGRLIASSSVLDMRLVLRLFNHLVDILIIVALVGGQMLLDLLRVRTLDDNREEKIVRRPFVMFIGSGHMNRQRRPHLIDQNMDLRPAFASVGRVFARILTAQRGRAGLAVYRLPFPANARLSSIVTSHLGQDRFKHALFSPPLKAVVQDTAAYSKPASVDRLPLTARPHHIPDTIQNRSIICRWSPAPAWIASQGNEMFDPFPQLIRHFKVVHILRFCVSILAQDVSSLKDWFGDLLSNEIRLLFQPSLFFG